MRISSRFPPVVMVCGAVLIASALLPLPQNGAILGIPSLCPFFNLTGFPCPGCGLTRAFVLCAHGQFAAAFAYHPLGPILFGAVLFYVVNALLRRPAPLIPKRNWTAFVLVVGLFWVLRLNGVWPLPAA